MKPSSWRWPIVDILWHTDFVDVRVRCFRFYTEIRRPGSYASSSLEARQAIRSQKPLKGKACFDQRLRGDDLCVADAGQRGLKPRECDVCVKKLDGGPRRVTYGTACAVSPTPGHQTVSSRKAPALRYPTLVLKDDSRFWRLALAGDLQARQP